MNDFSSYLKTFLLEIKVFLWRIITISLFKNDSLVEKTYFGLRKCFVKITDVAKFFFVVFPVSRLRMRFQKLFLGSFLANREEKS